MKLVDNAKKWYKMFSLQANLINTSFLSAWAIVPEKFQSVLPTPALIGIAVALLVLGTVGRLIKQESVEPQRGING